MNITPDSDSTVDVNLFEPEQGTQPTGVTVRVFLNFPDLVEITTSKIMFYGGDGQQVLWEKPPG